MFEHLIKRPKHLARYRSGPYAEERRRFLNHIVQEGRSRSRLKVLNRLLLEIAMLLDLSGMHSYSVCALRSLAEQWQRDRESKGVSRRRAKIALQDFVFVASSWLRFLGRLARPVETLRDAGLLAKFLAHLKEERGYAEATIVNRSASLKLFLCWLEEKGIRLSGVSPVTVSAFFSSAAPGRWKRNTVSLHVQSLRAFFRYARSCGWCEAGIAESIDAPRLYTYESLPQGPSWAEVNRLLASVGGRSPLEMRSRCVVLLCAVYGLRIGEVSRLRLDDIDWVAEKISVHRPKQRKVQTYPLTAEAGNVLVRYLRFARPASERRELLLTLRQPYRPVSIGGLSATVARLEKKLGLKLKRFGPHALRHACATHLLAQGLTMKEVGDHLGHVSVAATRIYAKVDLAGSARSRLPGCKTAGRLHRAMRTECRSVLCQGRYPGSARGGRHRSGRYRMKITDAIQEFILYKQSLGMSYRGRALKLNAFARLTGPVEIDSVSPEVVRRYLDGERPITAEWAVSTPP